MAVRNMGCRTMSLLTPVEEVHSLLFKVGDRVEAMTGGNEWRPGVVVASPCVENRFPPGFVAAYQIQLDDEEYEYLIFAPHDGCVRRSGEVAFRPPWVERRLAEYEANDAADEGARWLKEGDLVVALVPCGDEVPRGLVGEILGRNLCRATTVIRHGVHR